MKKSMNTFIVLTMLFFASCKKNNTEITPPVTMVPKIKTSAVMKGATLLNSVTFEYDNAGRRAKATYMDGSRFDFTFTANTVLQELFNSNGVSQNKYNYNLNAAGLADVFFTSGSPNLIIYLTYSGTRQLLSEITKTNGTVTSETYHVYDNTGNDVQDSLVQANGTTIRTSEYYTDKISTIGNINSGDYYEGVGSKNCQKKITVKNPNNTITTYDFTIPELDALGRVIKQSYTYGSTTTDNLYSYY